MLRHAPCPPVSMRGKNVQNVSQLPDAGCVLLQSQQIFSIEKEYLLRRLYSQLASSALSQLYLTGVNINDRILWVDCSPSVLFLLTAILTFLKHLHMRLYWPQRFLSLDPSVGMTFLNSNRHFGMEKRLLHTAVLHSQLFAFVLASGLLTNRIQRAVRGKQQHVRCSRL